MNFYIGMTEGGDAGLDMSWYNKALCDANCKGLILITKAGHLSEFQEKALALQKNHKPVIIHFTCTGWGGTDMEPGVRPYPEIVYSIRTIIDSGFPAENVVLRVDPIIPTEEGLKNAADVLRFSARMTPEVTRIRVSIYDDYHKAREEIMRRNYPPVDSFTKWKNEMERRPSHKQISIVANMLKGVSYGRPYELCAEPELEKSDPSMFHWTGCLSEKDLQIMGISVPQNKSINGQGRYGCKCLTIKRELLGNKRRCEHNCAYCYWGR